VRRKVRHPGVHAARGRPDPGCGQDASDGYGIETFVDRVDPGGIVLPLCDAGFTHSHWLRERHGTVAYGFFPMREMTTPDAARAVHGLDERMPLSDLALQIDFYRNVVTAVCGDATTHQSRAVARASPWAATRDFCDFDSFI
jgi:hypothetical protein